jgi:DNA-directed RNA polymerase subunit RPC12/RpoP
MVNKLFIKGAYLWTPKTMDRELTEKEFVQKAGVAELMRYRDYPFVSLVFTIPSRPFLVGHKHSGTIAVVMNEHGRFQTMEWKKPYTNWKCVACGTETPDIGPKPDECEVCGGRRFSKVHARKKEFYN